MVEIDGHEQEEKEVFCKQVGYAQTRTTVKEGTTPPYVRIELKYDDTYRNDMPPKFEKLPPLFKLEPYEARLLGKALIAAANAGEAAIKKLEDRKSRK